MNRTTWIVLSVLCVIGLGALVVFTKKETVKVDTTDPTAIIANASDAIGDNVTGKKDSKVILVEYGDFQCPGCAGSFSTVEKIVEKYGDRIAFVFREFPLTQIHPNAYAAASAAESAGLQGKFWEMYRMLYQNRDSWVNSSVDQRSAIFEGYATQIGLNIDTYKQDLVSKKVANKIARDQALGNKQSVSGTPTFFIDKTLISSADVKKVINGDSTPLETALDEALKNQ